MDDWRALVYPLGFIPSLAFGARFIVQWLESEKRGKSVVTPLFWHLSLIGNILLLIHSMIQGQFHVALAQICNSVISWRNLNLMQTRTTPASFSSVLSILVISCLSVFLYFYAQTLLTTSSSHAIWFRIPIAPWETEKAYSIAFSWHLLGFIGYILFSSRFWVQWWLVERANKSYLPPSFWWLSLIGAILSNIYFLYIGDFVNLIGPLIGLIPYVRNLMLIYKTKKIVENT